MRVMYEKAETLASKELNYFLKEKLEGKEVEKKHVTLLNQFDSSEILVNKHHENGFYNSMLLF